MKEWGEIYALKRFPFNGEDWVNLHGFQAVRDTLYALSSATLQTKLQCWTVASATPIDLSANRPLVESEEVLPWGATQ